MRKNYCLAFVCVLFFGMFLESTAVYGQNLNRGRASNQRTQRYHWDSVLGRYKDPETGLHWDPETRTWVGLAPAMGRNQRIPNIPENRSVYPPFGPGDSRETQPVPSPAVPPTTPGTGRGETPKSEGVRIVSVQANSTAATLTKSTDGKRVILEPGDFLCSINGRPIQSDADYRRIVGDIPRNSQVSVEIINWRTSQRMLLYGRMDVSSSRRFGATLADNRETPINEGVRIVSVQANSTAATLTKSTDGKRVILEPGDFLCSINGQLIQSDADYRRIVGDIPRNSHVSIEIINWRTSQRMLLYGRMDVSSSRRFGATLAE